MKAAVPDEPFVNTWAESRRPFPIDDALREIGKFTIACRPRKLEAEWYRRCGNRLIKFRQSEAVMRLPEKVREQLGIFLS
jgi:hypothetical protein